MNRRCLIALAVALAILPCPAGWLGLSGGQAWAESGSGKDGSGESGKGGDNDDDDEDDDDSGSDDDDEGDEDDSGGGGGSSGSGRDDDDDDSSGPGGGGVDDDGAAGPATPKSGSRTESPSTRGLKAASIVVSADGIAVTYTDGSVEMITGGRYTLVSADGRRLAERRASAADVGRMQKVAAATPRSAIVFAQDSSVRVAEARLGSGTAEVIYSNGWGESVLGGVYQLTDAFGRTVVRRTATAADLARLRKAAGRS